MSLPSRLPAILQAVMQGQPQALADSHYPQWHLAPVNGLLNDPNGFCQVAGRYHLFYQWNPLACDHTYKCWGHWSSADLLHWRHEPIALMPDEEYDRNGCYSGSAVEFEGALTLCYTGNVKFPDGGRTAWQCLATENADGTFRKLGPVLPLPEGYTGHVRDPKVWRQDGRWYMVLGAQDVQQRGKVLLFTASDLREWRLVGEIAGHDVNGLANAGYMWECPDFFTLEGQEVLSVSPQGLTREEFRFQNIYQSGYFILKDGKPEEKDFREWDHGFDFYAPQTFQDGKGRRILIGWMGMPDADEEYVNPTAESEGWQHCLTVPREVTYKNGMLYQYPVKELNGLRENGTSISGSSVELPVNGPFDLDIQVKGDQGKVSLGENLFLEYQGGDVILTLSETAGAGRKVRKAHVPSGKVESLRILADTTAVEIYVNGGEVVFSTRYYPETQAQAVKVEAADVDGKIYGLKNYVME